MANFWATWKYKLIAGVAVLAALAIVILGAHHLGYNKGRAISEVEIARYEQKVTELQNKVNTKIVKSDEVIVTNYVDRIRYQDRIVYQNRDVIKTVVVDRPVNQSVSNGWVYAHNQSALMRAIDPNPASDANPSGISDNTILLKVTDNYAKANACIAQLESLQEVVRERERILNETAKN